MFLSDEEIQQQLAQQQLGMKATFTPEQMQSQAHAAWRADLERFRQHDGPVGQAFKNTFDPSAPIKGLLEAAWDAGNAYAQGDASAWDVAKQTALPAIAAASSVYAPGSKPGPQATMSPPEAISGGAGMNNIGKGQRGMAAVPNLRGMTTEQAIATARGEPHLIPTNSSTREGYYVGGPQSVTSPEQLVPMRAEFDRRVAAGAPGRDWYGNARTFNREIAGSDPYRQRLAAHEEALWSAQANPDTNLGFALQGHNAYEAGVPMDKVRTGAQAQNYNQARDAGTMPTLGKKTGVYGQHLDPTVPYATTGTNDIWHARALGYQNKDGRPLSRAIQAQEHAFMDYETMLAADRANAERAGGMTDWNGPRVQAAPWVGGKGEDLHRRFPKRFPTVEAGIAEASKTYPDYAPKYTFSATSEQIPGKVTGIAPGLIDAPAEKRQAFSDAATWKNADGQDAMYSDAGLWVRKTQDGTGHYENSAGQIERNPAEIGAPLVSFKPGDKNGALQPHDRALVSAVEATRGLLDAQEGSAGNMVVSKGPKGRQTAFHVDLGRQPTKTEMDALAAIAEKRGLGIANADNGVTFLDFTGKMKGSKVTKFEDAMRADIEASFQGAKVRRGRPETVYHDFSTDYAADNAGRGLVSERWMTEMENLRRQAPGYFDKLVEGSGAATKSRANLKRLEGAGALQDRPDYVDLLRTVGEGKLRALYNRIKTMGSAGLPAIGIGVLGAGASRGLLEEDDARS